MALKLSEKQLEIVEFMDGALLVKAGPGSGKTRVLIERIKHIIKKHKRSKILALTFSNLAAEEMKSRLEEDSEVEDLIENVNVGTIHSFALDLVQRRGNLIGLSENLTLFENNTDRQKMLREVILNDEELKTTLRKQEKPDKFLNDCLNMIAYQKKKFVSPEIYDGNDVFKKMYLEYNQYLVEQNALDFDDILFYAYRILMENPSVQNMYAALYKFICVDEAQDLNYAQYELIKALCGNSITNIMFVGDENQSIYGFNGSNSELMTIDFVQDFQPVTFELYENYRSSKRIVKYANKLKNTVSTSNYFYEGELRAFQCENERQEAELVLAMINKLSKEGHSDIEGIPTYEDFAVISRNRYALANIELQLKNEKIPYYYKKTISGMEYESDYVKVFDLSLRLYSNKSDVIHLKELCALVNYQTQIVSDNVLEEVLKGSKYEAIIEALKYMEDDSFDFGKGIKILLNSVNVQVDDENEKYLIVSDLEQLKKHWQKYKSIVSSENRTLLSFRNCISLGKTQDVSGDKGVTLLTAHMSKGLQFEVVFVVGLSEGTFPDYRAVSTGGKELEQEKNNMFVAATRAKRLCYFTYPIYKEMPWGDMKYQKPSRFLSDINIEVMDLERVSV